VCAPVAGCIAFGFVARAAASTGTSVPAARVATQRSYVAHPTDRLRAGRGPGRRASIPFEDIARSTVRRTVVLTGPGNRTPPEPGADRPSGWMENQFVALDGTRRLYRPRRPCTLVNGKAPGCSGRTRTVVG